MLSQVNYRVPNMRSLRERLTVRASWAICGWVEEAGSPWPVGLSRTLWYILQDLELRSSDITYGQFAQVYRSLMYSDQKTVHEATCPPTALAPALLSQPCLRQPCCPAWGLLGAISPALLLRPTPICHPSLPF